MNEIVGEAFVQYNQHNLAGLAANKAGDFITGLACFQAMDAIAVKQDAPIQRLAALNPGAKSLWSAGKYTEARALLDTASGIAVEHSLPDEARIAWSNMGRVAAHHIVHTMPVPEQAGALKRNAVPLFKQAWGALQGHDHLYYRYANAQHGSIIAALAGERTFARNLINDGLRVAFRRSPEPYDAVKTWKLSKGGLVQLAAAGVLLSSGAETPIIANMARQKLVR